MIRDFWIFAVLRTVLLGWAFLLFVGFPAFAQEEMQVTSGLKRNFIGIELGQTIAEFREQVSESENMPYPYFLYDLYNSEIQEGGKQETLLEVQGSGFIEKGVFQFAALNTDEPVLISITIFFNSQWSSYQQLFQKFYKDYGNPERLSPNRSIWQDEQTFVSLEKQQDDRPRYKIVDRRYLDGLKTQENRDIYRYEEFLQKF